MQLYRCDARMHELVAALAARRGHPYRVGNGGIPMIVAAVRVKLGDEAARTVKITVH